MKKFYFTLISIILSLQSFPQVGINNDGSRPDSSAGLEVKFIDKGFLPPRMSSSQIAAIQNPADGLMVYCTSTGKLYVFTSLLGLWKEISWGSGSVTPPFNCGMNITVNHIAGDVVPVTKTTTYGTVTNIPGESAKCWITSNLGSDHQASSVDDATEASAGWYWQFNRKQGYKHDGTTRTPNTVWITSISEDLNWQPANDPCNLLLGGDWRIPTYTELSDIYIAGGWTDWNGPWNSGLKLHAAGWINYSNGSLTGRGSTGYIWSSTRYNLVKGWSMDFNSAFSTMDLYYKAYGFSVRCLREN